MKTLPLLDLLRQRYPEMDKKKLLARILCGEVRIGGETVRDPKLPLARDSEIVFRPPPRFVSRGGLKLDHALRIWGVDVADKVLIDAGASSGGFTDCLLQRGARRVYCIDVGYNQLDFTLRRDERVVALERTNIMSLDREYFQARLLPDAAVADLSFRSLRRAAGHLLSLVAEGWLIALIKPQFEWRTPARDFDGVVRGAERHREILLSLVTGLWQEGVFLSRIAASPIRGRRGNLEFLGLFDRKQTGTLSVVGAEVEREVSEAVSA